MENREAPIKMVYLMNLQKQKVGGGGFGEIYEAVDLQNHNERVAIKVESSKANLRIMREI